MGNALSSQSVGAWLWHVCLFDRHVFSMAVDNNLYHATIGGSMRIAGLVLMAYQGAGMVGSLLGGMLYDRYGARRIIPIGAVGTAVFVFILPRIESIGIFAFILSLSGVCINVVFPIMYALVGDAWPEGGRKAFNLLYVSSNLGVALGAAIGGMLAQISFMYVFLANGLLYLAFLWIVLKRFPYPDRDSKALKEISSAGLAVGSGKRRWISLLVLCVGYLLCWMAYVQWQSNISTFMLTLDYPTALYSLLWTVNGLVILCAQPLITYVTKRWLVSLRSQLIAGVILFMLALLGLSQFHLPFAWMIVWMTLMTLGEILIWAAVPTAAAELAPPRQSGRYQGMVSFAATAGRMVGPVFGAIVVERGGAEGMLWVMSAILLIPIVHFACYHLFAKDMLHAHQPSQ
ncbi:MFS transporter [Laceyella sacchari]|uniref:MFS transporter n=1 Tax=Laceyella sacchari TaxID=37482 RepID=UPI00104E664B|nr:MFS transporter [Laceyella sacchari]